MEKYQERVVKEYQELKEKYEKLKTFNNKYESGELEFQPKCPLMVMKEQEYIMESYLFILEKRARIEGFDLKEQSKIITINPVYKGEISLDTDPCIDLKKENINGVKLVYDEVLTNK